MRSIILPEKRQYRRASLLYYLQVHDLAAGKDVGHLIDISFGGFKVLSKSPIHPGNTHCFKINLPDNHTFQKSFTVKARACWSQQDVNPDYYATGFCFNDLSLENFRLIKMLMHQYELDSSTSGGVL